MTIRSLTLVALVMVMGSSSGCCGMKNFMFGRGARCGLCSRARAVGSAINPLAAPPAQGQPPLVVGFLAAVCSIAINHPLMRRPTPSPVRHRFPTHPLRNMHHNAHRGTMTAREDMLVAATSIGDTAPPWLGIANVSRPAVARVDR